MIFVKLAQLKTLNLSDNKLRSLSELLPLNNAIKEFYIKNNDLEKITSTISRDLKKSKIIDFTRNICIDIKYE